MPRSEITHDSWGDVKIEIYSDDGFYLGSDRPGTDIYGNPVINHHNYDGNYIGCTYVEED